MKVLGIVSEARDLNQCIPATQSISKQIKAYSFGELKEAKQMSLGRMEVLGIVSEARELSQAHTAPVMDHSPPFLATYKSLFGGQQAIDTETEVVECCDLPLIDLSRLHDVLEAAQCKQDIVTAASEWGFFQIVSHGIPDGLLARLREEQVKMFRQPFKRKTSEKLLDFSDDSYRWGTPTATSLKHLSWSEAFHVPLSSSNKPARSSTIRCVIEELSLAMAQLATQLVDTLAEGFGRDGTYMKENCTRNMCYLRLNRYPPCPIPAQVFGLVPHTDSDFLTILCQDEVIGLQLKKGGRWFTVRPNPNTLVINIGDLFQAWSNGLYKSVEHRVMSNPHLERFSVAYFMCPSNETVIESSAQPAIYRKFSFGEYRQQVQQDVRRMGHKVGLTRFLA
ncbi:gibberellin 2-beta-dioxygenase 8-like isoform X1 [Musa acuminata AAA Group]|uniref:gibberellin 2-beta-dioxygenase 8-like isoform X1 n=1 Tax=Musa acuminata AAA Group TaxID=214697 RepID=UPI0031D18D3D